MKIVTAAILTECYRATMHLWNGLGDFAMPANSDTRRAVNALLREPGPVTWGEVYSKCVNGQQTLWQAIREQDHGFPAKGPINNHPWSFWPTQALVALTVLRIANERGDARSGQVYNALWNRVADAGGHGTIERVANTTCPSCAGGSVTWSITCPVCFNTGKVPINHPDVRR